MASSASTPIERTTTALLDALRDPSNEPAWVHIDARYRPVIAGLARRLGLGETDADEIAQQTLAQFVRAYRGGQYDRQKGRLSSWILGIARHEALRVIRDGKREGLPGATVIDAIPDEPTLREVWIDERDRTILERAIAALREESSLDERTLLAFELTALRSVPAAEASVQCGLTVDQVYVARSRVTKRLRSLVEQMTRAFEEDA